MKGRKQGRKGESELKKIGRKIRKKRNRKEKTKSERLRRSKKE